MKKEDVFVWGGGAIVKEVWRCPECSVVGWPFFSIDIFLLEVNVGRREMMKRMIKCRTRVWSVPTPACLTGYLFELQL